MKNLVTILFLGSVAMFGQGTFIPAPSFTPDSPFPGAPRNVLLQPGSALTLCNNTTLPCTSLVTTYTSIGVGTACSTKTQAVNPTSSTPLTCSAVSQPSGLGDGFWVNGSGTYYFSFVTPQGVTYGPYPISAGGGGSGGGTSATVSYVADASQGIVHDGTRVTGCTGTSGQAVLVCTNGAFSAQTDVGKNISLWNAPVTDNYHNVATTTTTILSVQSATQVTLNANIGTSITSGGFAKYGTDNGAALLALIHTACNVGGGFSNTGGATIYFPPSLNAIVVGPAAGEMKVCGDLHLYGAGYGSNESVIWYLGAQSTFFFVCDSNASCADGVGGTNAARKQNFEMDHLRIDMSGTTVGAYSVNKKLLEIPWFQNVSIHDNIFITSLASMINIDDSKGGLISDNFLYNCGYGNDGASLGGSCIGWGTTGADDTIVVKGNYFNGPGNTGAIGRTCAFAEWENTSHGTMIATDNFFTNCNIALGESGGFYSIFANNDFNGNFTDIQAWEGTVGALPGQELLITGNNTANSVSDSIVLSSSGAVSNGIRTTVCDNKINSAGADGIHIITSAARTYNTIDLCNNDIYSAGTNGIEASGTLGIVDLDMRGNNIQDTATAILISVPVTRGNWSQNRAWNSTGSNAVTGLNIGTALMTDLIIGPNDFTKVTTTPYVFTGATWAGESRVLQTIPTLFAGIPANVPAGSQWVADDVSNAATYNSTVASGGGTPGAGTYFDLLFDGTNWKAH